MSVVLTRGVMAVSIDLELDADRRGLDQQQCLDLVGPRLINLLAEYQIPATWAVADPAVSAATDLVLGADMGHELAILGERTWVGREAGRSRFSRELARRVSGSQAAELPVSALVLRDAVLDDHADVVLKQGLAAVTTPPVASSSRWFKTVEPPVMPLRFGLWSFPTQMVLPGQKRFLSWSSARGRAQRMIDRAAKKHEVCHLSISGLSVAAEGRGALGVVERVLKHAARRRQQGYLEIETLSAIASRLTGGRQSVPARSILRPAA